MATSVYNCDSIAALINDYIERGGEYFQIEEGTLGYGMMILFGEGLKTTLVKEIYLNEWSSTHTIRMYNKTPAKYKKYTGEE